MASCIRTMMPAARNALLGRRVAATPMLNARSFHASPATMKKNRKPLEVEQVYPDEDEGVDRNNEEDDDLFASSAGSSSSTVRDPSAQLQPLLAQLDSVSSISAGEARRKDFSHVRVGTLRRIVQLYPSEEIEGLKNVLRQWRALGGRVTRKTAEEIIGRFCNLGRPDLALELIQDRTQYGLPELPTHTQTRLNHTLLQSSSTDASALPPLAPGIPISKTLATLHLALRQKAHQQPISQPELAKLVSQIKKVRIEVKEADAWRKQARGSLDAAGGIWADAGKRIEAAGI